MIGCETSEAVALIDAFNAVGLVQADRIAGWDDRQYASDHSTGRVRRHRGKRSAAADDHGGAADETVVKRFRNGPEQSRPDPDQTPSSLRSEGDGPEHARPDPANAQQGSPLPGMRQPEPDDSKFPPQHGRQHEQHRHRVVEFREHLAPSAGTGPGDGDQPAAWRAGLSTPATTNALGLPRVPAVRFAPALLTTDGLDRPECWPEPLRSCIGAPVYVDRITDRGGWDGYITGYEIRSDVPAEAAAQAAKGLKFYQQLCAPLHDQDLARELCRLRTMLAVRAETELDWQFKLHSYMEELEEYPADIVVQVLRYWGRNEKWWPTWAELHDLLERRVRTRLACIHALDRVARSGP